MAELKPCPFCGAKYYNDPKYHGNYWFTADHDEGCFFFDNVMNDGSFNRDEIKKWNRRAAQTVVNQMGDNAVNINGSVCTFNL